MKKLFLFASAAALVLSSCSDDLGNNLNVNESRGISKIIASYPIGTGDQNSRTYLEGGSFHWSKGDGIGVFNAESNGNVNGQFSYVDGTSKEFDGDIYMYSGEAYYAYYPFAAGTTVSNDSVTLLINPTQNFNHSAKDYYQGAKNGYGSFASTAAAAVAYGTLDEDNLLDLTFKPAVSFLRVPITGYTQTGNPLKTVTLTNKLNEGDNQQLAGQIRAYLGDYLLADDATAEVDLIKSEDAQYQQIVMNCGVGLNLTPDSVINLWFVVPAGFNASNSTFSLTFSNGVDKDVTMTKTITKAVNPFKPNAINSLTNESSEPFYYNPANVAMISTGVQFLEYAYIVSTDADKVLTNWNALDEEDQKGLSLPNMVIWNEDSTEITGVMNALFTEDITIDVDEIIDLIGEPGTGKYQGLQLPDYLQDAFGNYVSYGYIPTIGGEQAFTINANGYTLSGLKVQGNGFFNVTGDNITINNLTLSNDTVQYVEKIPTTSTNTVPRYSFFNIGYNTKGASVSSSQTSPLKLNESTLGAKCQVIVPEGVTFPTKFGTTVPVSVFSFMYASQLETVEKDLTNNSGLPLAFTFWMDKNTDLTGNPIGLNSFWDFGYNTNGVVATVANEKDAKALIDSIQPKPYSTSYTTYSVIDENTSYWTGTVNSKAGTYAENFAYAIQNGQATATLGAYNLDLMGLNWWNGYDASINTTVNVEVPENGVTISGVSITGLNNDETPSAMASPYLTLLGNTVTVTGGQLTISDITVDVAEVYEVKNAVIAAIGNAPGTKGTSKIIVNSMNITADAETFATVGGLYASLNEETVTNVVAGSELSFGTTSQDLTKGWLAGTVDYVADSENTWTVTKSNYSALNDGTKAFGIVTVTINGNSSVTDGSIQKLIVNLKGFELTVPNNFNTPITNLGDVALEVGINLAAGSIIYIPYGNASDETYYQLTVNKEGNGFIYSAKVIGNPISNNSLKNAPKVIL